MFKKQDRNEIRRIRHERVRKKISGTPERPRLCVYRSLNHIYAQVIDDVAGRHACLPASTLDPQLKDKLSEVDKKGASKLVGQLVAERAKAKGMKLQLCLTAAAMCTPVVLRKSPMAHAPAGWTSKRRRRKMGCNATNRLASSRRRW